MKQPFQIFDWQRPFLPDLKEHIMAATNGHPGRAIVITPNERPVRYFIRLFETGRQTIMLPLLLPIRKLIQIWRRHVDPRPHITANILDQAALLWPIVCQLTEDDAILARRLAKKDMGSFLPWGILLARLLEDMLAQGLPDRGFAPPEGAVEPLAERLLQSLGAISSRYRAALAENSYTTPGLDSYVAAAHADNPPERLMSDAMRPVFIAGFSTLNGTENKLLQTLWQAGAQICLHGDLALAHGGPCHWACADLAAWIRNWHASALPASPEGRSKPEYFFYAAYDGHSQLRKLISDLENAAPSSVIVLPQPDLLLPALHEIGDKAINISMGYPLARAPLRSLIASIFAMHMRKRPAGRFHWRDVRNVLQHPLFSVLECDAVSLRPIFSQMDHRVRLGGKYADIQEIARECSVTLTPGQTEILNLVLTVLIEEPQKLATPAGLAHWLGALGDMLESNGHDALMRFPLDAEALARIRRSIIPALARSQLAHEPMNLTALNAMLSSLMDAERIPFEADPLVGTQILGMLETRLLHFDEVFILDAADEVLPGQPAPDPLLPDYLRNLMGLSASRQRQAVMAYNLFRLCMGAHKVHFYWPEGIMPDASGHKRRSRFVEKLIWEIEQDNRQILKTGDGQLEMAFSAARLMKRAPVAIACSPDLDARINALLAGEISAAMLNEYVNCPLAFALSRLLRLNSAPQINENDNPLLVGNCAHAIFRRLLEPYIDAAPFSENNVRQMKQKFADIIGEQTQDMGLRGKLPVASEIYFEYAAPRILGCWLDWSAENTPGVIVRFLEKQINARLDLYGRAYKFTGRLDRIDERDGKMIILDYKTGTEKSDLSSLWTSSDLLAEMETAIYDDAIMANVGDNLLARMRELHFDIQMPLYMLLASEQSDLAPDNAAYIYPGAEDRRVEMTVFPEGMPPEEICRLSAIPLTFLLRHLATAPQFAGAPGKCKHCAYAMLCGHVNQSD